MEDEKIIDLKAIIEARKEKGEVEQNTHEIIAQAALYSFYSIIREYDDILYCMYKTGTSPADLFEVAKKDTETEPDYIFTLQYEMKKLGKQLEGIADRLPYGWITDPDAVESERKKYFKNNLTIMRRNLQKAVSCLETDEDQSNERR